MLSNGLDHTTGFGEHYSLAQCFSCIRIVWDGRGRGAGVVVLKHRLLGLTSEFQSLWVWKGAENLHT